MMYDMENKKKMSEERLKRLQAYSKSFSDIKSNKTEQQKRMEAYAEKLGNVKKED